MALNSIIFSILDVNTRSVAAQSCKQPPLPWCIQPQSTVLLLGATVLILALLTPPSMTPCKWQSDAYVLHQQTAFQSLLTSNLLSFVAMEPHCL